MKITRIANLLAVALVCALAETGGQRTVCVVR